MKQPMKRTTLLIILAIAGLQASAQDSIRKREVSVTSTFKPTLKEAAKIHFSATPQQADTTRPRLQYDIPNQNLLFAYQPGNLRPVALSIDTANGFPNASYVKAGYGSLRSPYFETGISLGNGKTAGLNIYGRHISAKGKEIKFQDFSSSAVDISGFLQPGKNIELSGKIGAVQDKYNKYGYLPKTVVTPEDSMKIEFQTLRMRLAARNKNRNEVGISYTPEATLDIFTDRLDNRETNAYFNLPVRKTLGGKIEAEIGVDGGITNYSPDGKGKQNSNYFSINPSVIAKTNMLYLQAGIKPSWDNGTFRLLPNVMAELSSTDQRLTLQAGWIARYRINSYQSLAAYNPYIWRPDSIRNSRIEEIYAGLKGTVTDHFSYSFRAGVNKFTNQPLFLNSPLDSTGKSFAVVNEPEMKALNFHGEFGYSVGEKFSINTGLTLNRYFALEKNDKAWGLLPLQFNTAIRLQVLKDLYAKVDLYAFDAPQYRVKTETGKLEGAFDASAGLEFAVVKNLKIWAQFNNILNSPYERWKQYPVYGFNFMGGVVFSLAQNKK
jgi:hypothetical protein